MATPLKGYWLDGKRIPGVTTVLSKFKEAGGLMHWAWQCGMDGKDYRQVRDDAASSGTLAHKMAEQWARGEAVNVEGPAEILQKANQAFAMFLEWADQTKLTITDSETSLMSKKHRFGGTLDAMLVNHKLALGDWKTSNGIYEEYLMQIAAYAILWEENFPDRPITGGFHLLRFAKETPDFTHHYWAELEGAKRGFLIMRELYDIKADLKKRL